MKPETLISWDSSVITNKSNSLAAIIPLVSKSTTKGLSLLLSYFSLKNPVDDPKKLTQTASKGYVLAYPKKQ